MRFTFDRGNNAAYLGLSKAGEARIVAKTYACDPLEVGGMINLDFDAEDRLIGIEILGATTKLRQSVISVLEDEPFDQA